jgi:hypothetical protein
VGYRCAVNLRQDARRNGGRSAHVGAFSCDRRRDARQENVYIPVDRITLQAELTVPPSAIGVVLVAQWNGSGCRSPSNQFLAWNLHCAGLGTLLIDLVLREEELESTLEFPHLGERIR